MLTLMPRIVPAAGDAAAEQDRAGRGRQRAARRRGWLQLGADRFAKPAQRQAASDGALGVIFGGVVGTERGKQAVAAIPERVPRCALDDVRGSREGAVHQLARVFGIERARLMRVEPTTSMKRM